jgi:LAO/AO transport system kinase
MACSAIKGEGLVEIWASILDFRERMLKSGEWQAQRRAQARDWLHHEVTENMVAALKADASVARDLAQAEKKVGSGKISPVAAGRAILARFLGARE